jgi:hypothetical protein
MLRRKLPDTPSFYPVHIDGVPRGVVITDVDGKVFSTKNIVALPGEPLPHGGLVNWRDQMWLITAINPSNDIYVSGTLRQCNCLLRWLDDADELVEQWCVVEDGTTYLAGERDGPNLTIGDARLALTIGKNAHTEKLGRGQRFLIDDPDAHTVLAYEITKPNRFFNVFAGHGVYRYVLSETNVIPDDNQELMIANYFNRHPPGVPVPPGGGSDGRETWL